MPTLEISKIQLPGGSVYDIRDDVARATAAGAIQLKGSTTTALTDGATTNPIQVNGESYTAIANDAVFYGNAEFVFDGTVWHEFGDMSGIGEMGKVDTGTVTVAFEGTASDSSVSFSGDETTDSVLGANTTITASDSSVTFGQHTTASVLTDATTGTVPKTVGTTKYLTASASGTAVGVATSNSAITDLGTPSTENFVKSYPGETSKLNTTSVIGVSSSTTTASKATAGTAVSVATTDTAVTVATGALGTETTTRGADTPMWGASVSDQGVLSFTFKPITTGSVVPAKSNGTITPYTFADVTVPIKATTATTVATGSLSDNGSGSAVMTGLGTAVTDAGVTGYASPTTDTFAKTVSVTAQPAIALNVGTSTSTGAASFIASIAESGTNAVTFSTNTKANAITALGAATAAGQAITVGSNDLVDAVTGLGSATAAGQAFAVSDTFTVYPSTQ